ncbi:FUSC family protein [Corallococcus aberystwythensis]|uniref:FUSC family protein n=1 Tax=Corallococcus aberystwythensis TaxID=2316722 RepID=UPI001FCA31B7|nr:FUSC family protein [Corallococcus aberystwythensis]
MIRRQFLEHAKAVARFAPVRPAVKAGLRAALAFFVPTVVGTALHLPGALWLAVGGFNTSFVDKGGSYHARFRAMGGTALAAAVSAVLGGLAGMHPALAIPATLLWVTAWSFAGIHGAAANLTGNIAATTFVIALGLPASTALGALESGLAVLGGSAWAMVLSLVLWPIRPYRPARKAVAACFDVVAGYAEGLSRTVQGAREDAWQALIQEQHGRIRETLELARTTLAATRQGRGERGRGERLLVLLECADAMFMGLIALGEQLESLGPPVSGPVGDPRAAVAVALLDCANTARDLVRLVEQEGRSRRPQPEWDGRALRDSLADLDARGLLTRLERARLSDIARLLTEMRERADVALDTACRLAGPFTQAPPPARELAEESPPSLMDPVRAHLTLDSEVLRHALRVGVTTTAAVYIASVFRPNHGYWVTITVLTIMQPYTGPTFLKALQRVLGTVVGGLLAIAVASWLQDPYAMMGLLFCTAALCVSLIPLNYGLFTVFATLTFVLLAEMGSGDWTLAPVRIVNTLIGGALALAGTFFLWQRSEEERFPAQLADALRADREFFDVLARAWQRGGPPDTAALNEARRKLGLATINAETSFQRLLNEPRWRTEAVEPLMTLLAFTRRFAAVCTLLASRHSVPSTPAVLEALSRYARAMDGSMEDLADAVLHHRRPKPLPAFDALIGWNVPTPDEAGAALGSEAPLLQSQLERLARQLSVLHTAATRRMEALPVTPSQTQPSTINGP